MTNIAADVSAGLVSGTHPLNQDRHRQRISGVSGISVAVHPLVASSALIAWLNEG
jgi:hypothetical protein